MIIIIIVKIIMLPEAVSTRVDKKIERPNLKKCPNAMCNI